MGGGSYHLGGKRVHLILLKVYSTYRFLAVACPPDPPSPAILADLTPDDTRQLVLAEDELATSRRLPVILTSSRPPITLVLVTVLQPSLSRFTRIFPTSTSHRYFRFMEKPRYYNLLLRFLECFF